jgi:hypothetical protein
MPQAFGHHDPRIFGMDAAVGFPPHGAAARGIRRWLHVLDRDLTE